MPVAVAHSASACLLFVCSIAYYHTGHKLFYYTHEHHKQDTTAIKTTIAFNEHHGAQVSHSG
eukprot:4583-Heterococcus_DN1.PRE.1